ncbi:MAG: DUF2254 domain-containing protein [Chthoniobacterales bacterium]
MEWKQRNRLASYLKSSLWIVSLAAAFFALLCSNVVHLLDARLQWGGAELGLEGARAIAAATLTLTLSFTVFTFSSLLLAVQIASGQYTPRIIATTLLRDNVIRYTVGLFVFTFLFATKSLARTETSVPQLLVFITALLGFACIVAFLFLIDYAARLLRPVSLVRNLGEAGLAVLEDVYPEKCPEIPEPHAPANQSVRAERILLHRESSAIVIAVNVKQLMDLATRADGAIEFAPEVGDFVGGDEPLFLLDGKASTIADEQLDACVIFGSERTLEQDPLFVFRILVDIAIKALSPAINDPTTAVLTIDQLHRLLRRAGHRNLRTNENCDDAGNVRVILRTPEWEDFVHLAFTEIRMCGAANVQIARRLRAMLLNLSATLPAIRQPALAQELDLLERTVEKLYLLPEDLVLARIPDPQGLGGSTRAIAPSLGVKAA